LTAISPSAQDEEDDDAGEQVGEQHRGAGVADRARRAEEQTDTDRAADRDELDLVVREPAGELLGGDRARPLDVGSGSFPLGRQAAKP